MSAEKPNAATIDLPVVWICRYGRALLAVACCFIGSLAFAAQFRFDQIATSGQTPRPEFGPISEFGNVALHDGNLAFVVRNAQTSHGAVAYARLGQLDLLGFDNLDHLGPVINNGFSTPTIRGQKVAFEGFRGPSFREEAGMYVANSAGHQLVIDGYQHVTGTPQMDQDGSLAFTGGIGASHGVYGFANGAYKSIAKVGDSTPVPGTVFGSFGTIARIDEGEVSFIADFGSPDSNFSSRGIFLAGENQISLVVDSSTPIPGTSIPFSLLTENPIQDSGRTYFLANFGTPYFGYYAKDDAGISKVFGPETTVSGGGVLGTNALGRADFDGQHYVLSAFGRIYTNLSGGLELVVDASTELDGRHATQLLISGDQSISKNQFAFHATFADGSQAIYLATLVPEPETYVLLIAILLICSANVLGIRERKTERSHGRLLAFSHSRQARGWRRRVSGRLPRLAVA
jgi:hypothetical protein